MANLINRPILKKQQCQIDEYTPPFSKSHMTKLSFYLDNNDILNMKIAEVYNSKIHNGYVETRGFKKLKIFLTLNYK